MKTDPHPKEREGSPINAEQLSQGDEQYIRIADPASALRQKLRDQLENAVDAVKKDLGTYESLRNLSEVIGGEYGDRVIFELVQNAHDAHQEGSDGRILLRLVIRGETEGDLYVANGGHGFDWRNVNAIRNVGVSSKTVGEGIGNKGLGFRSVETLTDDPRIYSQAHARHSSAFDGFCFRFANPDEVLAEVSRITSPGVAQKVAETLPRYLAAVPISEQTEEVVAFAQAGFATVVHVPLASGIAIATARKQVLSLLASDTPLLLFLERLCSVAIEVVELGEIKQTKILSRVPVELPELATLSKSKTQYEVVEVQPGVRRYLIARRAVDKERLAAAVERSIPLEPQLARWREWRGEPTVAVAVALNETEAEPGRIYNFLPMAADVPAPLRGHVDAPFYATIDRRRANFQLPLNAFLLDAIAETAAIAALELKPLSAEIGRRTIFDLATWNPVDPQRIAGSWKSVGQDWSRVAIVPAAGGEAWTSIHDAWTWQEAGYRLFRSRRLVKAGMKDIADPDLGVDRLARLSALTKVAGVISEPNEETLAIWAEAIAKTLEDDRSQAKTWSTLYEEIFRAFSSERSLQELRGRRFLKGRDGKLHAPPKGPGSDTPPVFLRQDGVSRRRDKDRAPLPPSTLTRKVAILDEDITLKPEIVAAFIKAGLVRRYDPLELLEGLSQLLGEQPVPSRREAAIKWAFEVWRSEGTRAEKVLPGVDLHVETRGGWRKARMARFSDGWTSDGRKLGTYLAEAGSISPDCRKAAEALLVENPDWALSSELGRREWVNFLRAAGVRDGLPFLSDNTVRLTGTPWDHWSSFLSRISNQHARTAGWVQINRAVSLRNPMTLYRRRGNLWRLPGQIEHDQLPAEVRFRLADLIIVTLRQQKTDWRYWRLGRYHRPESDWNEVRLHTPASAFIASAAWMPLDESADDFDVLRHLWATSDRRQRVPRYVRRPRERLLDLIQDDESLSSSLLGGENGLRDWSSSGEGASRLIALGHGARNLEARDRVAFRRAYERAWSQAVENKSALPPNLPLAVWQGPALEVLDGDKLETPKLYVAANAQSPEARAIIAAGLPLLELAREEEVAPVLELLAASGGFSAALVEGGEVTVYVDGQPFVPSISDPLLASDGLEWLLDATLLANEVLGRELERQISAAAVEDKLRRIRLRLCESLVLKVGEAGGDDPLRFYAYGDDELPTLVVADALELNWPLLAEAAPHLASLLDRRMRSLQGLLPLLAIRSPTPDPRQRPSDDALARALNCRTELVRELIEARGTDDAFLLQRLLPLVACFANEAEGRTLGDEFANGMTRPRLLASLERVRDNFPLLPEELVEVVLSTRDLAELRRKLGIDYSHLNKMLIAFGQPPLSNELELRRLFDTWKDELRVATIDRLRRRFLNDFENGLPLDEYLNLRSLDFVTFPDEWILEREEVTREDVRHLIDVRLNDTIGPDSEHVLEPLRIVRTRSTKIVQQFLERSLKTVSAWLNRNEQSNPIWTGGGQEVLRAIDQKGLLDFVVLEAGAEIPFLVQAQIWPDDMPATVELQNLGLTPEDLDFEKAKEEEQREAAAKKRRTFRFAGEDLDTGALDFVTRFAALAEAAMSDDVWLQRSRRRFRLSQMPQGGTSSNGSGGRGGSRRPLVRISDDVKSAMGFAGEFLASRFLAAKHGERFDEECWVSRNREQTLTNGNGDDTLGFDFRVRTKEVEWRYEVKASFEESFEFEFTQNEMRVAAECAGDGHRRYRILYVPFVDDPTRWRVMELPNPMADSGRPFFRAVGASSTRMRFNPTA